MINEKTSICTLMDIFIHLEKPVSLKNTIITGVSLTFQSQEQRHPD